MLDVQMLSVHSLDIKVPLPLVYKYNKNVRGPYYTLEVQEQDQQEQEHQERYMLIFFLTKCPQIDSLQPSLTTSRTQSLDIKVTLPLVNKESSCMHSCCSSHRDLPG